MKKSLQLLFSGLGVVSVIGMVIGVVYAWRFYKGVQPAFIPPSEDITELVPPVSEVPSTAPVDSGPLSTSGSFSVQIFAKDLDTPRDMLFDPLGRILVSERDGGNIIALADDNGDNVVDRSITLISELDRPHGLALRCPSADDCRLFVAATDSVREYLYDSTAPRVTFVRVLTDLPTGGTHFTRSLQFLPEDDTQLLVSIGSTCNACDEEDTRRATVQVIDIQTGAMQPYATGLRNAVLLAEQPGTGNIWVTEMGRDLLGDDLPPDELNVLERGGDYGWPRCYSKNIHDQVFDSQSTDDPCREPAHLPSTIDIPAHSSPIGLAFIPPTPAWPEHLQHDLLVSFHGSWNRSVPTGYKVAHYPIDSEGVFEVTKVDASEDSFNDFLTGFLQDDGTALGRPADILVDPSNPHIYVSDDKAGVVYLLTYSPDTAIEPAPESPLCFIGGCSRELCTDDPTAISACLFSPAFACYEKRSTCEAQANGTCGWSKTDALTQCLLSPE